MKLLQVLLLTLFTLHLFGAEPMIKETPYTEIKQSIGKGQAHFVEFGSDKCYSCQIMGKKLYKVKKENPQRNIEFLNVRTQRQGASDFKIQMIPTQLIFDAKGKEVYRHIGILEDDELHNLLKKYKI